MFLITKLQFNWNEEFNNHNTEKWNRDIRVQIQLFNPYPVFLGLSASVFSGKKIQSTETYTNLLNAALRIFFPRNMLGDGPAFWIFFPGFMDKG